MNSLKQMLAATDLSEHSVHAISRGFSIAAESGANLNIVHALGLDMLGQIRELLGENSKLVIKKIQDDVRETLKGIISEPSCNQGISATLHFEEGQAYSTIPLYADKINADLILLGAHGKGFLQRLLLGSTASRLLRKSKCPVLVVKRAPADPYRKVMIAVDFSPGSELAISAARTVAPGAKLILCHIFDIPFEDKLQFAGVSDDLIHQYQSEARRQAVEQIYDLAKSVGLKTSDYSSVVLYGNPILQILEQEQQNKCDLIVMGKHGTHVTEELLLGSITKRILAESECDVLVVSDQRKVDISTEV